MGDPGFNQRFPLQPPMAGNGLDIAVGVIPERGVPPRGVPQLPPRSGGKPPQITSGRKPPQGKPPQGKPMPGKKKPPVKGGKKEMSTDRKPSPMKPRVSAGPEEIMNPKGARVPRKIK